MALALGEPAILWHDHDSVGDGESAGGVAFVIESDLGSRWQAHAFVDDHPAQAAVAGRWPP
jgi:hypothetical protein